MKNQILISCCILALVSCGSKNSTDFFEHNEPVDISDIVKVHEWYCNYEGEDRDSLLLTKLNTDVPEYNDIDIHLFADNSYAIELPEYNGSNSKFLSYAENLFNSAAFMWNIWSNCEVWYRGHTAGMLRTDEDVKKAIMGIDAGKIKDADIRKTAQAMKDSVLILLDINREGWEDDGKLGEALSSLNDITERKIPSYYKNEEAFFSLRDSIFETAEKMSIDKMQGYLKAKEEEQVKVMLNSLANCDDFDEQYSLWRCWANCKKSAMMDDFWLVEVGRVFMNSSRYCPNLYMLWITWRTLCQGVFFGMSRDSTIPNHYYNEYRKKCYITYLKHIEDNLEDSVAINNAVVLAGYPNLNRFGQNMFGNEALIEAATYMPLRFEEAEEE